MRVVHRLRGAEVVLLPLERARVLEPRIVEEDVHGRQRHRALRRRRSARRALTALLRSSSPQWWRHVRPAKATQQADGADRENRKLMVSASSHCRSPRNASSACSSSAASAFAFTRPRRSGPRLSPRRRDRTLLSRVSPRAASSLVFAATSFWSATATFFASPASCASGAGLPRLSPRQIAGAALAVREGWRQLPRRAPSPQRPPLASCASSRHALLQSPADFARTDRAADAQPPSCRRPRVHGARAGVSAGISGSASGPGAKKAPARREKKQPLYLTSKRPSFGPAGGCPALSKLGCYRGRPA